MSLRFGLLFCPQSQIFECISDLAYFFLTLMNVHSILTLLASDGFCMILALPKNDVCNGLPTFCFGVF